MRKERYRNQSAVRRTENFNGKHDKVNGVTLTRQPKSTANVRNAWNWTGFPYTSSQYRASCILSTAYPSFTVWERFYSGVPPSQILWPTWSPQGKKRLQYLVQTLNEEIQFTLSI